MSRQIIDEVEQKYLKAKVPTVYPGDTVRVKLRIKEGTKERVQAFEGVVIKLQGSGTSKTMTVRRVFQGIGVERVFLINSPLVESIKVMRRGVVRRSKLYYLRQRSGKSARIQEKVGAALGKIQGKEDARMSKIEAEEQALMEAEQKAAAQALAAEEATKKAEEEAAAKAAEAAAAEEAPKAEAPAEEETAEDKPAE
ncbi:MAG: 50S ribosomal protein L19 [Cyanobacteria bacterium HKST-UBA06]|nr:50S ribosomal protein L19 [Cyanobacteria bacterium HKST-UBA04]MCA9807898.1 50S ribosomal protein L19 [Cyanobacteria bacterium HKST-UBA06]